MNIQKTKVTKAGDIARKWYVVDAEGQVLGRLASKVAWVLAGKGKPYYAPNLDCGDHVVVINAGKIKVTGNKLKDKMYYHHTGYIGGIKGISLEKQLEKKPAKVIIDAVHGMIPKSKLGRQMLTKLKVYAGSDHPHAAQQPESMTL